jgi:phosphoserine phosphatase
MVDQPPAIVAFDMDGTLLRGKSACELLADGLERAEEMRSFERLSAKKDIIAARETMAGWYRGFPTPDLVRHLAAAEIAPGAREGVALLRDAGVRVVIVSISWHFAVEWLADALGADDAMGTRWNGDGPIDHFWPEDKARWLEQELAGRGLPRRRLAAVGDSSGDVPMLSLARSGFFVGGQMPADLPHIVHWADAPIDGIARRLLAGG